MPEGKLKYVTELDSWIIVDKKNNEYEPNPCYIDTYFKNYNYYEPGIIACQLEEYQTKEPGWYVQFHDISFRLDKSQIYEVFFNCWEPTF